MKLITFDDIAKLNISPLTCYKWVEEVMHIKKNAILPTKISMKPADGVFCNVMPCISDNGMGVKIVTRYPNNEPAIDSRLLYFNTKTGELLALMDSNFITAMRTGAVAAHSVKTFATKDFSVLGLMGLGNVMRATMLVLLELFPDKQFTVKLLKYKNQHELFADRFSDYKNVSFVFVDSNEKLVTDSDVIISAATYLSEDVCRDECYKQGCLVVPVHTRGFTNCDLFFDKVFADDIGHIHGFKYFDRFKSVAEVCEVVTGEKAGRENERERILAYNIGIALHDLYFASKIYPMVPDAKTISLEQSHEKFWL